MQDQQNYLTENKESKRITNEFPDQKNYFTNALPTGEEKELTITIVTGANPHPVRYFDLVEDNSEVNSIDSTNDPFMQYLNNSPEMNASENFSPAVKPLLPSVFNQEDLIEVLLFYFDQILYLNEISEKLEKLNISIKEGDVSEVNAIALDCAEISRCCGMLAALAPLQRLAQLKKAPGSANSAFLIGVAQKEFRLFRQALKENLTQLKKHLEVCNLSSVS